MFFDSLFVVKKEGMWANSSETAASLKNQTLQTASLSEGTEETHSLNKN